MWLFLALLVDHYLATGIGGAAQLTSRITES